MSLLDASVSSMRVLRAVAEQGSFTEAARLLGYTQSAVSRQMASLERATHCQLVERGPGGTRLTAQGRAALVHVVQALAALEAAGDDLAGRPPARATVRLGWFATAGSVIVPRAVAALRRSDPGLSLRTREGGSAALVRALRAGTLDLALISQTPPFRAPDDVSPALHLDVLAERSLLVAVPAEHPFAGRPDGVDVADLEGEAWIGGIDTAAMGVWPGLAGRPQVAHKARDWMAKLQLVAAGAGITTIPAAIVPMLPATVQIVEVRDGPIERRRVVLAHTGNPTEAVQIVARALRRATDGS